MAIVKPKRSFTIKREYFPADSRIVFTGIQSDETGENKSVVWVEEFSYADLPAELNDYATAHGWGQKIGDKAALAADSTPEQRRAAIAAERDRIVAERSWDALTRAAAAPRKSAEEMLAELSEADFEAMMARVAAKRANAIG